LRVIFLSKLGVCQLGELNGEARRVIVELNNALRSVSTPTITDVESVQVIEISLDPFLVAVMGSDFG
jgi:hypothetical protein